MPAIGIKKTVWQGANQTQRTILKWGLGKLDLGVPAEFKAGATRWFIFYDIRISLRDIAMLGTLVKGLAQFPNYQFPTRDILDEDGNVVRTVVDKRKSKEQIVTYVKANWVDPDTLTIPDDVDPYTFVLEAQGAPNAIAAAESVPAGWKPVEVAA